MGIPFPNPASTQVQLDLNFASDGGVLVLTDFSGKAISKQVVQSGPHTYTFELSNLARGMYSCHLLQNGQVIESRKIAVH